MRVRAWLWHRLTRGMRRSSGCNIYAYSAGMHEYVGAVVEAITAYVAALSARVSTFGLTVFHFWAVPTPAVWGCQAHVRNRTTTGRVCFCGLVSLASVLCAKVCARATLPGTPATTTRL